MGKEHAPGKEDGEPSKQEQELGALPDGGLQRFEEVKSLMRKMMPVAARSRREYLVAQDEVDMHAHAPTRTRRHARRSQRGRDDARRHGTDRAARARWRALKD